MIYYSSYFSLLYCPSIVSSSIRDLMLLVGGVVVVRCVQVTISSALHVGLASRACATLELACTGIECMLPSLVDGFFAKTDFYIG